MNSFEFGIARRYGQLLDISLQRSLNAMEFFEFKTLEKSVKEYQEREKQGQAIANKPVRPPLAKGAH